MAFEHKDNRGSIFRNDRKELESHPDHTGDGKILCPHCNKTFLVWISAWVNDLKNSSGRYFSLSFKEKEDKPATPPTQQDFDEDIPF